LNVAFVADTAKFYLLVTRRIDNTSSPVYEFNLEIRKAPYPPKSYMIVL